MYAIRYDRRTTPRVKNGRVQRKHRYLFTARLGYVFDRESPEKGFRHVLTKKDLRDFIELIPDWDNLSLGLECIRLGKGDASDDGYYEHYHREGTATIVLQAWPRELWQDIEREYFLVHRSIFDQLRISYDDCGETFFCRFTRDQARAYTLLHVFLHELGHHHDRMTSKGQKRTKRGEPYAEAFALRHFELLFAPYFRRFGGLSR